MLRTKSKATVVVCDQKETRHSLTTAQCKVFVSDLRLTQVREAAFANSSFPVDRYVALHTARCSTACTTDSLMHIIIILL